MLNSLTFGAAITIAIESGASAKVLNPPTIEHQPDPNTWPSVD